MAINWFHCTPGELARRASAFEIAELVAWAELDEERSEKRRNEQDAKDEAKRLLDRPRK